MLRPKINVLEENTVRQVIDEAIQLLENPGVRVHNEEGLALLVSAGARVDRVKQVAYIPERLVWDALATTPKSFDLFNLNGQPAVHYGGDDVHFDPGSTAIAILDSQTGKQRPAVTADFVKYIRLVEALPQLDAQSTAMVCSDVVEEIGDLYRLYLALVYMRKPIITGAFRKDTWWVMKDMLVAAAGSEADLADKPLAVFDVCPSPPLLWSDLTCQNLIDCARMGIPAELISMPMAGATAPVTLAASITQHAAESLSGIVIHQISKSGSPIVWGGSPGAFDMREGTLPMGAAETWLIDAGYVQVGKALGLPTQVYMGMSDAKMVDAQCGLESMGGAMMAALCGANMVSGAGMLDYESCQSYEKLVIDAEIIGLAKRTIAGVTVREQPIALDIMRQMGHRGEYLAHPHTRKWYRQELTMPSPVIDRGSLDAWEMNGSKSAVVRAKERVDALLANSPPSPLPEEIRREIRAIAVRAGRQFGMQDLPSLPD